MASQPIGEGISRVTNYYQEAQDRSRALLVDTLGRFLETDEFVEGKFLSISNITNRLQQMPQKRIKAFKKFQRSYSPCIGIIPNGTEEMIITLVLQEKMDYMNFLTTQYFDPRHGCVELHPLHPLVYIRWNKQCSAEVALSSMIRHALQQLEELIPTEKKHILDNKLSPDIETLLDTLKSVVSYLKANIPASFNNEVFSRRKKCIIVGIEHANTDSIALLNEFLLAIADLFGDPKIGNLVIVGSRENNKAIKYLEDARGDHGCELVDILDSTWDKTCKKIKSWLD